MYTFVQTKKVLVLLPGKMRASLLECGLLRITRDCSAEWMASVVAFVHNSKIG